MRKVALLVLHRLSLLVALAASAALFVEYSHAGDPAFCGVGSGCLAVRMSPYSRLLGLPLPTLGLLAFTILFVLSLTARSITQHRVVAAASLLGGIFAVYLIILQATQIHAFCPWCVAVDTSSIVAAIAGSLIYAYVEQKGGPDLEPRIQREGGYRSGSEEQRGFPSYLAEMAAFFRPSIVLAWLAAGAAGLVLPFVWGAYPVIPPLPAPIAALQVPGKLTIVSFTDFECPFCRALHPTMDAVTHDTEHVALLRKMMPLSGHPGAFPAALAYVCAPAEKKPAVAAALYEMPVETLHKKAILADLPGKLGLDAEAFSRCLDAPETRAQIDQDRALFEKVEGAALPLTYVGPRVILGFSPDRLENAVAMELTGPHPSLRLGWLFALLGVIYAAVCAYTVRAGLALSPPPAARD
ncbi:MAG: vitamin K epoxide reductase family protein [Byssovorax sp.]